MPDNLITQTEIAEAPLKLVNRYLSERVNPSAFDNIKKMDL